MRLQVESTEPDQCSATDWLLQEGEDTPAPPLRRRNIPLQLLFSLALCSFSVFIKINIILQGLVSKIDQFYLLVWKYRFYLNVKLNHYTHLLTLKEILVIFIGILIIFILNLSIRLYCKPVQGFFYCFDLKLGLICILAVTKFKNKKF